MLQVKHGFTHKKQSFISIMKNVPYIVLFFLLTNLLVISNLHAQKDSLNVTVGKAILNKSLWAQPYRYENNDLKALTVQITINPTKNVPVDFNEFVLYDEEKKIRIRANEVAYYRADKKIYYKSKAVNQNYNKFKETLVDGYTNIEAETFKPTILGKKKKNAKSSIKQLKKITLKGKQATYYLDFPVDPDFTYGKIHYHGKPVGFAAITK